MVQGELLPGGSEGRALEGWKLTRKGCFFPDGLPQTGNLDPGIPYPGKTPPHFKGYLQHVCIYMYTHPGMHVCICESRYKHPGMHVCIRVCTPRQILAYTHACVPVCKQISRPGMHVCMQACIPQHTCVEARGQCQVSSSHPYHLVCLFLGF